MAAQVALSQQQQQAQQQQPASLSRYRSQRKAQAPLPHPIPPPPPIPETEPQLPPDSGLQRSRSRYRNAKQTPPPSNTTPPRSKPVHESTSKPHGQPQLRSQSSSAGPQAPDKHARPRQQSAPPPNNGRPRTGAQSDALSTALKQKSSRDFDPKRLPRTNSERTLIESRELFEIEAEKQRRLHGQMNMQRNRSKTDADTRPRAMQKEPLRAAAPTKERPQAPPPAELLRQEKLRVEQAGEVRRKHDLAQQQAQKMEILRKKMYQTRQAEMQEPNANASTRVERKDTVRRKTPAVAPPPIYNGVFDKPEPEDDEELFPIKSAPKDVPLPKPASPDRTHVARPPQEHRKLPSQFKFPKVDRNIEAPIQKTESAPVPRLPKGHGPPKPHAPIPTAPVVGVDAPISAVNAGERRVLVECDDKSILLPVTPTTTPVDLIRSAETCLTVPININASVLLEDFGKAGVQRPLRKYEHLRDVMNSWDDDRQNSFVLVPSATNGNDQGLEAASVPTNQPEQMSCYLYCSQKRGKWDKKWVTMRSDGQVLLAKNENSRETTNVCHMSDFDIYTPTPRKLSEDLKPKKKFCFAIKSQQKSSMFLSTENFVHFFATSDRKVAASWYQAIQGWRSWYLVNVMGEGKKETKVEEKAAGLSTGLSAMLTTPGNRDSHYQLGSFKPLLDLDIFSSSTTPGLGDLAPSVPINQQQPLHKSQNSRSAPPSSFPRYLQRDSFEHPKSNTPLNHDSRKSTDQSRPSISLSPADDAFAPTGLLGRSYSVKKAHAEREQLAKVNLNPFSTGPSLLNDVADTTNARNRGDSDLTDPTNSGHRRSTSVRRGPKPLIDLTPSSETPLHQRKGRGFVPDAVGPGGLIDSATSRDLAVALTAPPTLDRQQRTRGASISRSKMRELELEAETGILADGLLAHAAVGQGGTGTGRGITERDGQQGPLLDVREGSKFAAGSLLARVASDIPDGPVIDRSRGVEVEVGTGEGI